MPRSWLLAATALLTLVGCRAQVPEPHPEAPARVRLVAVGDIMMHHDVKKAARENGGFESLWAEVSPLFRKADLVFGNLETPIAPLVGQPGKPYLFNAPADLPEALKNSGFSILSTANNHTYDQGPRGLRETQTRLEVAGLVSVGSGGDKAHATEPRILQRNGIRIAFLAFTDLFNADLNREEGPWVNSLDDQAVETVRAARSRADAVVVSVHWGVEERHDPTPRQREMAVRLHGAGADLILGHHPHVLQPLEKGTTAGRPVAVAFSLGNFISNQDRVYDPGCMPLAQGDERDSVALVATFVHRGTGPAVLEDVGYLPLWTENNWKAVNRGEAARREIRVVRLDAPERRIAPWNQRRERIREVIGDGMEWTE